MKLTFSRSLLVALIGSVVSITAMAQDATGAGASFPAPIYAKWAEGYKAETGKAINYQSIGSSGGIKQIKAKTVDFGATDAPMSGDEVAQGGMVQFPSRHGWRGCNLQLRRHCLWLYEAKRRGVGRYLHGQHHQVE